MKSRTPWTIVLMLTEAWAREDAYHANLREVVRRWNPPCGRKS